MTFTRRLRTGGLLTAILAVLTLLATTSASAHSFTVTSTVDAVDVVPGDGVCATLLGECTLRAAIQETNALPGADSITLLAGTYTIAIPPAGADSLPTGDFNATNNPATGDYDISDDLVITGAGSSATIVDGAGLDRIFTVLSTATADISGVTVQNGFEKGSAGAGGIGSQGNLTLRNSVVRNNATVAFAGGVGNIGGTVTLIDSAVIDNTAAGAGGGMAHAGGEVTLLRSIISGNATTGVLAGGGIGNGADSLTLIDSVVSNNAAGLGGGGGGGIGNATVVGQVVTLIRSVVTGNTTSGQGGGINNTHPETTLVLEDSVVSNNTAAATGGGIGNNGGTVTMTNSTVRDNFAAALGGGVFNAGTFELTGSSVSGNSSGTSGGGVLNAGSMTITDSKLTGNRAGANSAAILTLHSGFMALTRVTVSGNVSTLDAGGIGNTGAAILVDSVVSGNTAGGNGGGIANGLGGGAEGGPGTMMLIGTTVSGNTAALLAGGVGQVDGALSVVESTISGNFTASRSGGIGIAAGTLTVSNSTISGNSSAGNSGGLGNIQAVIDLNNVTITGNIADSDGNGDGDGGGINSPLVVDLSNSIVAGNIDRGGQAPDCNGRLNSQGYNLIENTSGCTIAGDTTGNVTDQPAGLGALADNGGPTRTHALLPGSPAIDGGNPADPGGEVNACDPQDQRGVYRPQDGDGNGVAVCDIGAFEVGVFTSTLGKVTGGGSIASSSGSGAASFGFVVKAVSAPSGSGQAISGALTYNDHSADVKIGGVRFDQLTIDGSHAVFTGTADVNGTAKRIRVTVDDLGEPVSSDTFGIEVLEPGSYSNGPKTLIGGNIKIHE